MALSVGLPVTFLLFFAGCGAAKSVSLLSHENEAKAPKFLAPSLVQLEEDSEDSSEDQGENVVATVEHYKAKARAQYSKLSSEQSSDDALLIRPNVAENKTEPDVVKFSLVPKTFYGAQMKTNDFIVDLVTTLKWTDKRVAALIPPGLDSLTLSDTVAKKKIWMPEVDVTNRDVRKLELISTAVEIDKDGSVTKVERVGVQVKCKYMLEAYPFDEQKLVTKIASTKLMLDELKLEPISEDIEVPDDLFDGEPFIPIKYENGVFEDVDGLLKKSRGTLTITIDRDLTKYAQTFILPAILFTCISWGVFWLPFTQAFVTPRLTLSILALLTFTNLSLKESGSLPPGAPFNWNELLVENIQAMMFSVVLLNIVANICHFSLACEDIAWLMNHEVKALAPLVTVILVAVICLRGYLSLESCTTITEIITSVWIFGYTGWVSWRAVKEYRVRFPDKPLTPRSDIK